MPIDPAYRWGHFCCRRLSIKAQELFGTLRVGAVYIPVFYKSSRFSEETLLEKTTTVLPACHEIF